LVNLIVLRRVEDAADGRFHTQHGEVVAGDHLGLEALGLVVDADRRRDESPAQHFGERFGAFLEILIDGIRVHPRSHVAAVVRALLVELHELVRVRDGQLPQQQLIQQGEDRGIGADAECQRQDRHGREQRTAAQPAQRQAKIAE
jgi:hypothetical protein